MAYTSPITAVTGATFTAAQFNTSVRDNLNAIWVGTTAGDLDYYASSSSKTRLAIGTALQKLRVNAGATAPEWATDLFSSVKRQGGSSSTWSTIGTNNYTPAEIKLQFGVTKAIVSTASGYGTASVDFPEPFSSVPILFFTPFVIDHWGFPQTLTSTGFTMSFYLASGSTITVSWLCIGPP